MPMNNFEENNKKGYINICRSLFDNPLWTCEPFDRAHAWIDLIGLAAYKDGYFIKRGNQVEQPRGWVCVSQKGLADRWRWSVGKVDRFLKFLQNEKQIVIDVSHVTTRLQIVNYDQYQYKRKTDEKQTENRQETDEKQTETINTSNTSNTVEAIGTPQNFENHQPKDTFDITKPEQFDMVYSDEFYMAVKSELNYSKADTKRALKEFVNMRAAKQEEIGTAKQLRHGAMYYLRAPWTKEKYRSK